MNNVIHNPLVFVLLLGALIAVLLIRGIFLGYPRPVLPPGALLSVKEQAIVAAAADALFPAGGPIPVSGTEAGLVAYMDSYLQRVPRHMRLLIRMLLAFVEHGPWIFGPRPARFTRLSPAERVSVLADMSRSSIYFRRVAFLSLRMILSMGYLANKAVAQRIGWEERCAPFEVTAKAVPRAEASPGVLA